MPWRKNPIFIKVEPTPYHLKLSSLSHFRVFTMLLLACAALAGWLFGSGLVALKTSFEPDIQLKSQKSLLEYKTLPPLIQESLNWNMSTLNSNPSTETMTEDLTQPGKNSTD